MSSLTSVVGTPMLLIIPPLLSQVATPIGRRGARKRTVAVQRAPAE